MVTLLRLLLVFILSIIGVGSILSLMAVSHAQHIHSLQARADRMGISLVELKDRIKAEEQRQWMKDNEGYGERFVSKLED